MCHLIFHAMAQLPYSEGPFHTMFEEFKNPNVSKASLCSEIEQDQAKWVRETQTFSNPSVLCRSSPGEGGWEWTGKGRLGEGTWILYPCNISNGGLQSLSYHAIPHF